MFYKIREITQVSVLFSIPRFFFIIRKIDNFFALVVLVNSLKRYSKGGNGKNEEFDQIW